MTIEIDDTSTGEIVGSAFIGVHRIETEELVFKKLPYYLFDSYGHVSEVPAWKIASLSYDALIELKYQLGEPIRLCTGHYFKWLRWILEHHKIKYEDSKIEGFLQESVEGRLLEHLKTIGVNVDPIKQVKTDEDHKFRSKFLKKWVAEDYQHRLKFVKSGYKNGFYKLLSFISSIRNVPMEEIYDYLPQDSIASLREYCLEKGYHLPQYYYEQDGHWSFERPVWEDQLRNYKIPKVIKVGIALKPVTNPEMYQESLEDEQSLPDALSSIRINEHGSVRAAELKASASICFKLNITHKSFEESPYFSPYELSQLKTKREKFI